MKQMIIPQIPIGYSLNTPPLPVMHAYVLPLGKEPRTLAAHVISSDVGNNE
jgi:hypothetical protein